MISTIDKERLREAHQPGWSTTGIWLGLLAAYFALQGAVAWVLLADGPWWLLTALVIVLGHVMHAHVLAMHEAAHGSLAPSKFVNDCAGIFIAVQGLMSFALYRAVHHSHHAWLSTERDEELWPFVDVSAGIWTRRAAALLELTLGLFFSPFLFLRGFLRAGTIVRNPAVRLRVWLELVFLVVFWVAVVAVTAWFDAWSFFACCYLLPAMLAGNLQSLRKYIEHMGMTGSTVLGCTRSIIPSSWPQRLFALSVFNIHYHGVHHKYAQMHASHVPEFADTLQPERQDEPAPFPSYWHALHHMLAGLGDPRVGGNWLADDSRKQHLTLPTRRSESIRSRSA